MMSVAMTMVRTAVILVALAAWLAVQTCQAGPTATHYSAKDQHGDGSNAGSATSKGPGDSPRIPVASELPDEYKPMVPTWMKCAQITGVTRRLEALPGTGWDNLANRDMGFITDMTYDECRTTPDGKFLIPDNVNVIPVQRSEVRQYADMYSKFTDYRSATAQSMSMEASYSVVSGSFSQEYEFNKQNQYAGNLATSRVQIRHELYVVEVKPDAKLAPALKSRLMNIAALLQNMYLDAAKYEIQLIVRDYGTHMIRSVVAGGALVHEDQVKDDYTLNKDSTKSAIKAAASASFMFSIGFSFGYSTSKQNLEQFRSNVAQATTRTFGGPPYGPNFTINEWEKELLNSLVAVDRIGDPIEYAISSFTLSELPTPTVRQIASGIEKASKAYVNYNTHIGCTDRRKPSFNYQANVGDDTYCEVAPNNYTFGGVYQTCQEIGPNSKGACTGFEQKNPLSGSFSCPKGYSGVLLHTGKKVTNWNKNACHTRYHSCGFLGFSTCSRQECRTQFYDATAQYSTFWCVRLDKVQQSSGYLFGGIYTNSMPNPVTEAKGCPKFFYPLVFGDEMRVCVSDDYERGFPASISFAGFFSCKVGNPLSFPDFYKEKEKTLEKIGYGNLEGRKNWPHRCPDAFSQHLASIDDFCEINYCVRSHAFDQPSKLLLQRPPYGDSPPSLSNKSVDTTVIVGPAGETWTRNSTTGNWEKSSERSAIAATSKRIGDEWNTPTIAVVASGSVLVVILVVLVAVLLRSRRRLTRKLRQGPLDHASAEGDSCSSSSHLLHDSSASKPRSRDVSALAMENTFS